MMRFQKITEEIREIFGDLSKEYEFGISIDEYKIELVNKTSMILITTERYYPDIFTHIINLRADSRNKYRLRDILKLRKADLTQAKNAFLAIKINNEKDSDDMRRIKTLVITEKLLSTYCQDLMQGNFGKIDEEGFWELSE